MQLLGLWESFSNVSPYGNWTSIRPSIESLENCSSMKLEFLNGKSHEKSRVFYLMFDKAFVHRGVKDYKSNAF